MIAIVLGFKTQSFTGPVEVIYAGNSGEDAARALQAVPPGKYVRAGKLINPMLIPVALAEASAPAAHEEFAVDSQPKAKRSK